MSGSNAFYAGIIDLMGGGYGAHTWDSGVIERLGIDGLKFVDGPRGVVMYGATTFPVSMARGATFDVDLEERIGEAIGREVRALGGNLFGGVCINLPRHPAWGRAQETYGEDPEHLACFGAAAVRGVQRHAMACVKHYALNSMENARFRVDVTIGARALHEISLPHFRRCVEADAACIMSAYNSVNGEYCGENEALLTRILKKRWGFRGYVITDFIFGLRDGAKAVRAGQDVEMPLLNQVAFELERWVREGKVSIDRVNDAVLRILTMQLEFAAKPAPAVDKTAHAALAREAAAKSIVVLKNDGLLPLENVKRLAVIGKLAAVSNTGDGGSSNTRPDYVVTPLNGLRAALAGQCEVLFDDGSDAAKAAALAASCDAAIIVAGYTHADEGEFVSPDDEVTKKLFPRPRLRDLPLFSKILISTRKNRTGSFAPGGDRTRLTLRPEDETLILAVAQANSRTAVAVMAGSTVLMEAWRERVAAILMLWYPG
jgi:beta-glucosidase